MKTLVLAAMMVTMLTISATPALASASQLSHQIDMNHRPYPYVTDGILFQGNIGIDCRLPDRVVKKYKDTKPPNLRIRKELEDAVYTLRKCRAVRIIQIKEIQLRILAEDRYRIREALTSWL